MEVASNSTGQPGDFHPGDTVTMTDNYIGHYTVVPGTYTVKVQWWWINGGITVSDEKTYIIEAPSGLCDWLTVHGAPSNISVSDVFVIIDSYLFETSPSGYDFIPTLQNVFGVMDYYLGFDGDGLTGCGFYS